MQITRTTPRPVAPTPALNDPAAWAPVAVDRTPGVIAAIAYLTAKERAAWRRLVTWITMLGVSLLAFYLCMIAGIAMDKLSTDLAWARQLQALQP